MWISRNSAEGRTVNEIGAKAVGLLRLPKDWTPDFIILTTRAFRHWQSNDFDEISALVSDDILIEFLSNCDEVLVRSSAEGENLHHRGRLLSLRVPASPADVANAINSIFSDACDMEPQDRLGAVAIVVQRYISPERMGHLSNERRITRRRDTWRLDQTSPSYETRTFRPSAKRPERRNLHLHEGDYAGDALAEVARSFSEEGLRYHFEWLESNNRVWLVQCDSEGPIDASTPLSDWSHLKPASSPSLRTLKEAAEVDVDWPKIQNVRLFAQLSLPRAMVFVLDSAQLLDKICRGINDETLYQDLVVLTKHPTVIRTDLVRGSVGQSSVLAPRTDCIDSAEQAVAFIRQTSIRLLSNGLNLGDFAFILNRFVGGHAGVLARAAPANTRVHLDAIWGVPEGLNYFPYDSYEFDLLEPFKSRRRIRQKPKMIDVMADGTWRKRHTGDGPDWEPTLSTESVNHCGRMAIQIAEEIQQPVEVMFLVDIPVAMHESPILPWHVQRVPVPVPLDVTLGHPGDVVLPIRSRRDLEHAEERLHRAAAFRSGLAFRLDPTEDLLRSPSFIREVGEIARRLGVRVLLEGSVLAHAYYLLASAGAPIVLADDPEPFQPSGFNFNKLVRDNIPDRIRRQMRSVNTVQVEGDELRRLVASKAIEEANEVLRATDRRELTEELADLFEVMLVLMRLNGIEFGDVDDAATRKRKQLGSFDGGYVLVDSETLPLLDVRPRPADGRRLFGTEPESTLVGRAQLGHEQPGWRQPVGRASHDEIVLELPYSSWSGDLLCLPLGRFCDDFEFELEARIQYRADSIDVELVRRPVQLLNQPELPFSS